MERNKFGFTLIELLVVIIIIIIFAGLTLPSYNLQTRQLTLKNEAKKLASTIELAKKKAVASETNESCANFNGFQVAINANGYSLIRLCDDNQTVSTYQFPVNSNISITVGAGNILNFPPAGFGINLTTNTITLKNSSINQCINIFLSSIGIVDISASLTGC